VPGDGVQARDQLERGVPVVLGEGDDVACTQMIAQLGKRLLELVEVELRVTMVLIETSYVSWWPAPRPGGVITSPPFAGRGPDWR
jgi:hypothetical protein